MRIPIHSGAGMASAKASDRTIVAVALVVCAAILAMGTFALLAADRVDTAARQRWAELVAHALDSRIGLLQRDLASFAHWDESVLRTAYFLDVDWVHRNFGKWLHNQANHDRSYIMLDTAVAYAAIDGEPVSAERATFDRRAILPFILDVQKVLAERTERDKAQAGAEIAGVAAPAFRAGYVRIEGRPALIGAIGITPDYGRVIEPEQMAPVAVSVQFLDERFLEDLAHETRIAEPALSPTPPTSSRNGVPIPFASKETEPAWLVWRPDTPGTALLRALLPALIATTVLLLTAATAVLWYARRATQNLAASEAYASRLAYVDPLCGLPNRAMLMRVLGDRLERLEAEGRKLAVFFLDLDGFKDINDTLGHHVGDVLLAEIGTRLKDLSIPGLLASRFGGDEFVILVPLDDVPGEVEAIGTLILEAVRRPMAIGGHALVVSGSIGATIAPTHSSEASELIRLADIAVYRAKAEGRGMLRAFEPRMEQEVRQRREIEVDLQRALRDNELTLFYQPQFSTDGHTVVGFEALLRWLHPSRGLISPAEFVPVAEQSGLISELDLWAVRRACEQAIGWGAGRVAVNLSPIDFRMPDLADAIWRILEETGFPAERLEIEITENLLLGNQPEAFASLTALRNMGVRIALDDFGSGYSSLGYLRRFRVDTIKIDRSFIQNIGKTDDAAAIIDCVVRLARALAITVTAEGVETREQLRYLQSVGCHHVQGYLLASPMPVSSLGRYLDQLRHARDHAVDRQPGK
ncbi:putative bifunctional diguanylate cyclase/phosphodiesterase [Ancylobacter oerskovii]|uniref:Bifunctional diguanylate cyclase/phosphodiesterase n=1 Tax=Ancylobacter oerskovii TaxID=459519 RepID=A0ABW4Z1I0_9HYPH|nr:bifunctional diguanylate cyclase/phosphodiesterase [Ancylobacter oerskovii]MBS7544986.1 bifunctional diguanylate cyclase/phosphodiesterase [Ancylobacter oerskovii]